jgi:uncharacterized protein YjbJ (UPF0337 family)
MKGGLSMGSGKHGTAAQTTKGKIKEAVGQATGDQSMAAQGRGEQVAARMRKAAQETLKRTEEEAAPLTKPTRGQAEQAARPAAVKKDPEQ